MNQRRDELKSLLSHLLKRTEIPNELGLRDILARIDAIKDDFRGDGQMMHYLERRSYEKAYDYLEDPELGHRI